MKVNKNKSIEHSFPYDGDTITLHMRRGYTSKQYDDFIRDVQEKYGEKSIKTASEIIIFTIVKWNLEDEDGPIEVDVEQIYERVPLEVLGVITKEIQDFANSGALGKNN